MTVVEGEKASATLPGKAQRRERIGDGTHYGHGMILAIPSTGAPGGGELVKALVYLLAAAGKQ